MTGHICKNTDGRSKFKVQEFKDRIPVVPAVPKLPLVPYRSTAEMKIKS
jgi:hypothetical protein